MFKIVGTTDLYPMQFSNECVEQARHLLTYQDPKDGTIWVVVKLQVTLPQFEPIGWEEIINSYSEYFYVPAYPRAMVPL